MNICVRCQQPIHEADGLPSRGGLRHPYSCAAVPAVEKVAPPPPPVEQEVPVVIQVIKSDPEVILTFNKAKAAVVALAAAILGSVATAIAKSFL